MRLARLSVSAWPFYPALVVGALVAHRATEGDLPLPWMLRPVLVSMAIVVGIQVLASAALVSRRRGAVVALAAWAWLLGNVQIALVILAAGLAVEVAAVVPVGSRFSVPVSVLSRLIPALNALSVAFAVAVAVTVVPSQLALAPVPLGSLPDAATGEDVPDVWIVVLDGYPRADTLSTEYGFENDEFLEALSERGFDVAEASRSNYNQTILTLTSMLSMRHILDIPELAGVVAPAEQYRSLSRLLSRPEAVERLRELGYAVTSIPSPFLNVSIRSSDRYLDGGQLTWFELDRANDMAVNGPLGRLLAAPIAEQHRARIRAAFESLRDEAAAGPSGPRLVFAHVMAPHAPFLFDADGQDRELPACFPRACDFWAGWVSQLGLDREAFNRIVTEQIEYVNRETLGVVDAILRNAEVAPIIVVMSDHGSRLDPENPDEMFRNLFATHTPGHRGLFGNDATPISLFPRLFAAYWDIHIPEPPPLEFFNPGGPPLVIERYTRPAD